MTNVAQPHVDQIVTAAELLEHPEWDPCELVRGRVTFLRPSGARHGLIAGKVLASIYNYVRSHNSGVVYSGNTGVILERDPDTVRAPDAMFLSKDRMPASGFPYGYLPVAPDLAVEVVSPEDRFSDITERVMSIITAGTRLVWVLDPQTFRAYVFRPGHNVTALSGEQSLSGEDVLPGFGLCIADLFGP